MVVFNVLSAVVKNGKSHLCFIACVHLFFSQSPGGNFTQVYIIFLLPVETKDSFKVSVWLVLVVAVPKNFSRLKKHKHRLQWSGFKHVDQWQPNEF